MLLKNAYIKISKHNECKAWSYFHGAAYPLRYSCVVAKEVTRVSYATHAGQVEQVAKPDEHKPGVSSIPPALVCEVARWCSTVHVSQVIRCQA